MKRLIRIATLLLVALCTTQCYERRYEDPIEYTICNLTDNDMLYYPVEMSENLLCGYYYDWFLPENLDDMRLLPANGIAKETSQMDLDWFRYSDGNGIVLFFYDPDTVAAHTRRQLLEGRMYERAIFVNCTGIRSDYTVYYPSRNYSKQ